MTKKSGFGLLVTILLTLFFLTFSAHAQNALKIGTHNFPPYAWPADDGTITGLATELVRGTFHLMKIENYTIKLYPFARGLKMVTEGKNHALYPIQKSKERETILYFSEEPVFHSKWVFFIRQDDANKLKFDTFNDLKGKRIGLVRDYKYIPALWNFVKKEKNYEIVSKEELNFKKLAEKRIDYLLCEYAVGMRLAKKIGMEKDIVALMDNPIESTPVYITFSKKAVKKDFVEKFSNELKNFKSVNYEKILHKYLSK